MVGVGVAQKECIYALAPLHGIAPHLCLLLCGMLVVVEGHTEVNQNLRLVGTDFNTTTANLVGASMDCERHSVSVLFYHSHICSTECSFQGCLYLSDY